jgi:hypothetical protein
MSSKLRTVLALVVLGASAFGSADSFSVTEQGSWSASSLSASISGSLAATLNNTTVVATLGGATFSLTESSTPTTAGVAGAGTFVISADGSQTGQATFTVTGTVYSGATLSFAGSMVLTSATGAFAGYSTGTGNIVYQLLTTSGGSNVSVGAISANLQAVPEPGFLGAGLLVGLIALRRRR